MIIQVKTVEMTKNVVRQLDKTWGNVDPRLCHPIGRISPHVLDPQRGGSEIAILEWSKGPTYTLWMDAALFMGRDQFYGLDKIVVLK